MTPQQSIAHYRITGKLGEGGMGAVYRATDTKLGRDVAIKVLTSAFAEDTARMQRFEREAQALAALNHPNIAAIYGIEQNAIVMELVDGPEVKGPLPVETACDYARQIAVALEAAHEKGIIHRDLKPANIKVTAEGVVKVLDFGLAKVAQAPSESSATMSPTLSLAMTQAGMILGTAAYMSPEQARGKPVDKRADIWAFGVVLYELLVGRTLFGGGETVSDSLAAVITREPDWTALPKDTPTRVRRLLERCLAKDPKTRLRDIGEARVILDEKDTPAAAVQAPGRGRPLPWMIGAAVLLVVAAVLGFGWWRDTRPVPRPMVRLSVDLGPGAVPDPFQPPVISPDGKRVAFKVRVADGNTMLAVRAMDQAKAVLLSGTDGVDATPFFSPDGEWIAFHSGNNLKKIPAAGGAAFSICEAALLRGGSWGEDGTIFFSTNVLFRVPAAGGKPEAINVTSSSGRNHRWPQILPGGKAVLATTNATIDDFENGALEVIALPSGVAKTIWKGGYFGRYLADGLLVFFREGTLFGVKFDLKTLAVRGAPVPLVEDVAVSVTGGTGAIAFADGIGGSGAAVYLSGSGSAHRRLAWLDSAGGAKVFSSAGDYFTPRISPDGKRLVYSARGSGGFNIWLYDLDRETPTQVTFTGPGNREIVWAPDSKHIVFGSQTPPFALWWMRADGSGQPWRLLDANPPVRPWSFSPDGRILVFDDRADSASNTRLATAPIDLTDQEHPKAGKPEALLNSGRLEVDAAVSHDGHWIAYASQESGREQVFVQQFPNSTAGGKWRVSAEGGKFPTWSNDGRELFFFGADDRVMVVDYTAKGDTFTASKPRAWSERRIVRTSVTRNYDVAPDGKRIIAFLRPDDTEAARSVEHAVFLLNFYDEVKRRIP